MQDRDHRVDRSRITKPQPSFRSSARIHPQAAQVSLCRDGGLTPRDTAAIRDHLTSCARCRRVDAKLAEVRRVLGNQASATMPTTISMRIDRAIAEAAQGNGQWPPTPRSPSLYS